MDLAGFLDRFSDIVGGGSSAEVDGDRVLAGGNVDDRRRCSEEGLVLGKIRYAKGGGHDDEAQGLQVKCVSHPMPILSASRLTLTSSFFCVHISSRSLITRLNTPMRMSVFILLSCASSIMMTEYFVSKKSVASSRNKTPSVMNLIEVTGDTVASYRI